MSAPTPATGPRATPAATRSSSVRICWLSSSPTASSARSADDPEAAALALDLPIGSNPLGYEVWADPSMFATNMSVGAPPDSFFGDGQNWGFPPPLPARSVPAGIGSGDS